ncbi:MAG: hypothetical protein DME71_09320 [Verrucomicrobia bacterium]|nr:MAG: hypothetical protein DME71_09320 [Verrucomicrobiota bacterium]
MLWNTAFSDAMEELASRRSTERRSRKASALEIHVAAKYSRRRISTLSILQTRDVARIRRRAEGRWNARRLCRYFMLFGPACVGTSK